MTIKFGDEYYCVHIESAGVQMIGYRRDNPKATIAEQRAHRDRLNAQNADRHLRLKQAGYPRERRFQFEDTAKRYAREIEAECGFRPSVSKQFDMSF